MIILPVHPHLVARFWCHPTIIKTKLTNELQVKPDLVHPPSVGPAKDDAARTVEAQTLKLGPALFPSPAQNS